MIKRLWVRIPAGVAGELSSPGSTSCADCYFGIRSTPVLARKRSRSFCQKCRWQVTGKHTCMHLTYVALHGVTWCMVIWCPQNFAETAAVSCGTSHASAVSAPLQRIFKTALYKTSHSCRITCECSESAQEHVENSAM